MKHILGAAAHAARAAELTAGDDRAVGADHIEQARRRATPFLKKPPSRVRASGASADDPGPAGEIAETHGGRGGERIGPRQHDTQRIVEEHAGAQVAHVRGGLLADREGQVGLPGADGADRLGRELGERQHRLDARMPDPQQADDGGHERVGGTREHRDPQPAGPPVGDRSHLGLRHIEVGEDHLGTAYERLAGLGEPDPSIAIDLSGTSPGTHRSTAACPHSRCSCCSPRQGPWRWARSFSASCHHRSSSWDARSSSAGRTR